MQYRFVFVIYLAFLLVVSCEADNSHPPGLIDLTCAGASDCALYETEYRIVHCVNNRCFCETLIRHPINCTPPDIYANNIIGGPCPCPQKFSQCNEKENICYCAPDFIASKDRRHCIRKILTNGTLCELDSQCQSADNFAVCKNHVCSCKDTFIKNGKLCAPLLGEDLGCFEYNGCEHFGVNARCVDKVNRCVCADGFVRSATNESLCVLNAEYEAKCTSDIECLKNLGPGGLCINGTCTCNSSYFVQSTEHRDKHGVPKKICTPRTEVGQYCLTNDDCYQHHLSEPGHTMKCFFGECNCQPGYKSNNNYNCFKINGASMININAMAVVILLTIFLIFF